MGRRGYDAPFPHRFSGRALYQLSLVKSSEARRFVPPELRLVELCGYTLGGVYLARYDSSPAGAFDELVVLAGLVWNPPGSCAWAARVYVSNADAQRHGVKEVGLPSHTAAFEEQPGGGSGSWWRPGSGSGVVRVRSRGAHVCTLSLPSPPPAPAPRMVMHLPSFSGATSAQPALLRYSLALRASVRPVAAAAVTAPTTQQAHPQHALAAVLGGRPLLTLAFDAMEMDVGQPQRVAAAAQHAPAAKAPGRTAELARA